MYHAVKYDVAVVGAGPAGALAACLLARRGARVLLIDPSHPREKPCGGGITARALDLVAPVVDVERIPTVVVRSARFTASSTSAAADVPLDDAALRIASRTDFDRAILDAARRDGADVLEARVVDVRRTAAGFTLETHAGSRDAARLIGADGANSLVRRRLLTAFHRRQLSIATGYFAHGVTSDQIRIDLISNPPGYLWSFPRPGHLAIGVCAQADGPWTSGSLREAAAFWIARTGTATAARLTPYSWPIPSLAAGEYETLTSSGPDWCLVGDAAGLVDPITREGIYFALLSGQWAAAALSSDDSRALSRYNERVRFEIATELARAARLKSMFFRSYFTRLLIEALGHSGPIRALMADLVAGRQSYESLKWRLLKTSEVRLAAELLISATRSRRGRALAHSAG